MITILKKDNTLVLHPDIQLMFAVLYVEIYVQFQFFDMELILMVSYDIYLVIY